MLLTDKYADKIYGTITCYDRMIIQGYIPGWSHAEGMTGYLKANNMRIFDFANFSHPLTEQIRSNAQRIADENGIEIGIWNISVRQPCPESLNVSVSMRSLNGYKELINASLQLAQRKL